MTVPLQVFTGTAHPALAESIAKHLGTSLGEALVTQYKNGETRVVIEESVRGADVYVIQPTCHPVNHHLMEMLIMIDAIKRASALNITAVIPYYGYAKQEKKSRAREPITAKLVADLLQVAGIAAMAKPGGTVCSAARRLRLAALPPTRASSWQASSPSQWIVLMPDASRGTWLHHTPPLS